MTTTAAGVRGRSGLLTAAAALGCLALTGVLQMARDRVYPREVADRQQVLYVRSPEALHRIVLGFDALAADVYWIRAIQHYGGDRLSRLGTSRRYELLYPLLDITTSLDPHFNIAYRFGAIFLSEAYPGGAGRPDRAIQLLRKGIASNPGKWQYYHDIGFIYYWSLQDRTEAAAWFRRAAELPDAPNWLLPVAAAMLGDNDRVSARYLWRQILESEEEWLRKRAERALVQIDALDQIDRLNAFIASRPKPPGEPYTWRWFARTGALRGVPVDPTGTPYELDPETGRVSLSNASILFPLPQPMDSRR